MSNLAAMLEEVEAFPDAPAEHWAIATARVLTLAPDLYELVTGERP